MPELPDVEVYKRYLDATALHQKIEALRVHDARILRGVTKRSLQRHLAGRKLQETTRHGKHLFVKVSGSGWMRLHFGMTGFVRYFRNKDKTPDHVRMQIRFDGGYYLAYDNQRLLGQVGWVKSPEDFIGKEKLGPDAVNDLNFARFKQILAGRRGFVKSTLMNQAVIAGLGNVYSDEILFQARLAPRARVESMSESVLKRVFASMQEVLAEAVAVKADPENLPERFLIPHRHNEGRCPRCGGRIEKVTVGGRNGYACPQCQPQT